jgi:hypothetical protein
VKWYYFCSEFLEKVANYDTIMNRLVFHDDDISSDRTNESARFADMGHRCLCPVIITSAILLTLLTLSRYCTTSFFGGCGIVTVRQDCSESSGLPNPR